uniref:CSON014010 protein n=1 Tax=Culicoides sonorensis TaxID=179676 RepID=A0A336M999_CULSO
MNQIFNICRSGLPIITCRLGLLHKFPSTTLNQSKSHLFCSRTVLDPNTNVIKDVMLFKYENPKLYKAINFFALAQFCFWNYVSYFSYTNLRDAPVADEGKENLPFWQRINLGESKYRTSIAALCFLMGYGILFFSWIKHLKFNLKMK